MILAHYNLDKNKIYNILERFHTRYKKRRKFEPNQNGIIPPLLDYIQSIQIYKRTCIYSSEFRNNTIKEHLVIKIKRYPKTSDYYILNLLFEDYKDLL